MALQTIPGRGPYLPAQPRIAANPSFAATAVIDATAEKVALIGQVFNKDHATKTLDKIHFRTGALSINAASVLRVSVQDVSAAAGPPPQPDGTQDQYRDIAGSALTANTWTTTGLVTSDGTDGGVKRSVAFGAYLAIVFEYQTFTAADSVIISCIADVSGSQAGRSIALLFTASWATLNLVPNVILEFSDGTFGTLDGAQPLSAVSSVVYNSGTAVADEYALQLSLPFPCKADGGWIAMTDAASADFDIILYDGTSAMANGTVSFDDRTWPAANAARYTWFTFADQISLTANTTYRLALKPTTANNVTLFYFDVAAAGHFQALEGGTAFCLDSRLDSGAWIGAVTTRRPWTGLRLSAFDDATGAIDVSVHNTQISIGRSVVSY